MDETNKIVQDTEDTTSSNAVQDSIPSIDSNTNSTFIPSYVGTISTPPKRHTMPQVDEIEETTDSDTTEDLTSDLEFIATDGGTKSQDDIFDTIFNDNEDERDIENPEDIKIVVPLSNSDSLTKELINRGRATDPEKFIAALKDVNTPESIIRDALDYFTPNTNLSKQQLTDLKDKEGNLKDILSPSVGGVSTAMSTGAGLPQNLSKNGKVLSGKTATMAVTAMMQGIKSVPLWNSGFYITIRTPNMPEIAQYFNTVNRAGYEYGRELGAYYFLFADIEIKRVVLETLLPQILVGSNFQGWKDIDKLLKVISIHDYPTILWAMASMIYKDGFNIKLPHTDKCTANSEVKIDVGNLRQVDSTKIPSEAISFMMNRNTTRTFTDLLRYRNEIMAKPNIVRLKTHHETTDAYTYWHFRLKESTCADHLSVGDLLNSELFKVIHKPNTTQVHEFFTINFYKTYLPWIESIVAVTESGFEKDKPNEDEIIFIVNNASPDEREMFNSFLDIAQMEDKDFADDMMKYIENTRTTHFVVPVDECPHCHGVASTAVDGFIPVDMQSVFFRTSLMRMLNASK